MLYDPQWEVEPKGEETDEQKAKKILLRAADVIRENGWCQWNMENNAGQFCAVGAIRKAASDLYGPDICVAACLAEETASDYVGDDIMTWNDHLNFFGASRVMRALRKAADRL